MIYMLSKECRVFEHDYTWASAMHEDKTMLPKHRANSSILKEFSSSSANQSRDLCANDWIIWLTSTSWAILAPFSSPSAATVIEPSLNVAHNGHVYKTKYQFFLLSKWTERESSPSCIGAALFAVFPSVLYATWWLKMPISFNYMLAANFVSMLYTCRVSQPSWSNIQNYANATQPDRASAMMFAAT